MFRVSVLLFATVFFFSGCLGASVRTPVENVRSRKQLSIEVLRPDILERGGKVMVGVFKAGPNAEATPVLDRFSLTVLQGVADALGEEGSPFQYVRPDAGVPADFLIEGHIDEFRYPGAMDRVMLKKDILVGIVAEVKEMKGENVVALIHVRQNVRNDRKGLDSTAYAIGRSIGQGLTK